MKPTPPALCPRAPATLNNHQISPDVLWLQRYWTGMLPPGATKMTGVSSSRRLYWACTFHPFVHGTTHVGAVSPRNSDQPHGEASGGSFLQCVLVANRSPPMHSRDSSVPRGADARAGVYPGEHGMHRAAARDRRVCLPCKRTCHLKDGEITLNPSPTRARIRRPTLSDHRFAREKISRHMTTLASSTGMAVVTISPNV